MLQEPMILYLYENFNILILIYLIHTPENLKLYFEGMEKHFLGVIFIKNNLITLVFLFGISYFSYLRQYAHLVVLRFNYSKIC